MLASLALGACGVSPAARGSAAPSSATAALTPLPASDSSSSGASALGRSRQAQPSGLAGAEPNVAIAYLKDGDVYVLEPGQGTARITNDGLAAQPWWTTDGKMLLFLKRRPGQPDESWRWQPGKAPEKVQHGLWSPDGQAVAFPHNTAAGVPDSAAVWVERQGTRQRITPDDPNARWNPLAWSLDGRRLALARYPAGGTATPNGTQFGSTTLWVTGQALTARSELPMPAPAGSGAGAWADVAQWSPDGKFLLVGAGPAQTCSSCRADGVPMYAGPVDGGAPIPLERALPRGTVSWSPSGDWLVMSAGPLGRATYSQMRLTRFNLGQRTHADLTGDPAWSDVEPAVSPDGSEIAFVRGHSPRQGESTVSAIASRRLWVLRADGSRARQVVETSTWTEEAPSWTQDGKWIIFVRLPADTTLPARPSLWAVHPDGSSLRQLVPALAMTLQPSGRFGYYGDFDWLQRYAVAPASS